MADFVPAQTSVPNWLMTYNRQLADVHFSRKLNRMYVAMLQGFLAYEPWKADPPFPWRMAKIHGSSGLRERKGSDPGWVPLNMHIPVDLSEKIKQVIDYQNTYAPEGQRPLSMRTFLYTVVVWWCTAVYEYKGSGMLDD